jgi:hypothetical protein
MVTLERNVGVCWAVADTGCSDASAKAASAIDRRRAVAERQQEISRSATFWSAWRSRDLGPPDVR